MTIKLQDLHGKSLSFHIVYEGEEGEQYMITREVRVKNDELVVIGKDDEGDFTFLPEWYERIKERPAGLEKIIPGEFMITLFCADTDDESSRTWQKVPFLKFPE
ncbi:hypothetical protein [Bdellovibrio sp. HCB-162]|uniref:hypothetical protein n=1 Tax=Bdellovibrio sp. HCB-162 TaxID=3394234 RepID=UPI0039BCA367